MKKPSDRRKSPKTLEAEQKRKEEQAVPAKVIAEAMRRAFATADGRIALREIMIRCNYQKQITATAPGVGVDPDAMVHNAALHKHYLWLRQHVDRDSLISVEIDGILLEKTGKE
jgi:hypothetical protein